MDEIDANVREQLTDTFAELARLAHAMNNPLTTLIGRAQLLGLKAADEDKVASAAKVIEEAAGRIATHVSELGVLVRDARERLEVPDAEPALCEPHSLV